MVHGSQLLRQRSSRATRSLRQVVEQLDAALSMPDDECVARLAKDNRFVSENTTTSWLHVAVQDMRRVRLHAAAVATTSNVTRAVVASGTDLQVSALA